MGGIVCALTTGVVRRGGVIFVGERKKPHASEAVHKLDLVCIIEREDRCVCIPIVLACVCAKEVMCTRLVKALIQAVKLGHFDGDGGNHSDVKVLVEHRCAPIHP